MRFTDGEESNHSPEHFPQDGESRCHHRAARMNLVWRIL